jgi:hypothetical protein
VVFFDNRALANAATTPHEWMNTVGTPNRKQKAHTWYIVTYSNRGKKRELFSLSR